LKIVYWMLVLLIVSTLLCPWTRYGAQEGPHVNVDLDKFKLKIDAADQRLTPLPVFLDRPNKQIDWQYTGIQLAVLAIVLAALIAARALKFGGPS
jgi:hypothetical protein